MRVDHGVQNVIAQILVTVNGVTQISGDLVGWEDRQTGKIDRCPTCRSHHRGRTERETMPRPGSLPSASARDAAPFIFAPHCTRPVQGLTINLGMSWRVFDPDIRMTYRLAQGKRCTTPKTGYGAGLFRHRISAAGKRSLRRKGMEIKVLSGGYGRFASGTKTAAIAPAATLKPIDRPERATLRCRSEACPAGPGPGRRRRRRRCRLQHRVPPGQTRLDGRGAAGAQAADLRHHLARGRPDHPGEADLRHPGDRPPEPAGVHLAAGGDRVRHRVRADRHPAPGRRRRTPGGTAPPGLGRARQRDHRRADLPGAGGRAVPAAVRRGPGRRGVLPG